MNWLVLNNVSIYYNKDNTILKNINLSFSKGLYVLIGENGAGKTSLLKTIARLNKKFQGEIKLFKNNIFKYSIEEYYKYVGILFQNNTVYDINVLDFLSLNKNFSIHYIKENKFLSEIYEKFKIGNIINKNLLQLSGGELQKLNIFSLFYQNPKILLLDEVFNNLDYNTSSFVKKKLNLLKKDYLIVLVSHDINDINMADCILYIEKNQIKSANSIEEFINTEYFKEKYKGLDYKILNKKFIFYS